MLIPGLGALSALVRSDAAAADVAARLALSLTLLAALGRGARLAFERRAGGAAFAPAGDPVLDALLGLGLTTVGVFGLSFGIKRLLGLHEPLGPVIPIATVVLAAMLCAPARVRRHAVPKAATILRLALFVAGFAWLAGDHLGARSAYSSDPDQHIAWLAQVRAFGFVPDTYLHTTAPITYPQGFHAMLYALGGASGIPASSLVALAPPLASALFVYAIVVAGRALAGGGERRGADAVLEGALFLAAGAAFHSAQFSIWNVYEGTARLSAGLLHIVPVLALLSEASAGAAAAAPVARAAWLRHALLPCAALALCALAFLLNPTHLPLQVLLFSVAIGARLWLGRAEPGLLRGLVVGAACGAAIAIMMLSADPVGRGRWLERSSPGPASPGSAQARPQPEHAGASIARVETEFDASFDGRTCIAIGCIARAASSPSALAAVLLPLRTAVEGPLRVLLAPGFDRRQVPLAAGPHNFPDWTGRGIAPLHGWARLALVPLPLLLLAVPALRRRRRLLVGLALLGLACSLDAGARAAMRVWVDPDDAALRLLPDYANRASAVVFAQSIGPLLAAGGVFGLGLGRGRRAVPARAAIAVVLGLVFVSAESELRDRQREVAHRREGPSAADLRDLGLLEAAHMPLADHYLVASHVAESNRERWLLPVDPSLPLYLQSERPSLFLYHLSSGARVTARDFEATCAALAAGPARPPLLDRYAARWVAVLAPTESRARGRFSGARFCGLPLPTAFPAAELAGQRGRVALFRLW